MTALDDLTDQFHDVKTAPRKTIATRAGQTKTMPPAVKSVTSLLRNHLDKQMLMFKKSNPEVYAGYVSARVILDRHGKGNSAPTPSPPRPPHYRSDFNLTQRPRRFKPARFFMEKRFRGLPLPAGVGKFPEVNFKSSQPETRRI